MNTPEEFEQEICRIHELLERSNEIVTWNDHVRDPDNPKQLRQIDVTVRRNAKLTIIECRLTRNKQNVKWIEELIGRRQSLNADNVIAVSSAGFTKGAQSKAARFGVLLRDLRHLSDQEILSWGGQTTLVLYYYQYHNVTLRLGLSPNSIVQPDEATLENELRSHHILQSAFNAAATQLDTLNLLARSSDQMVSFRVRTEPLEAVYICGQQVLQVEIEGKASLTAKPITLTSVVGYGQPAESIARRIPVERFEGGQASVVHDGDRVAIELDFSLLQLPPLSQIRYLRVAAAHVLEHESFAISSPQRIRVTGKVCVNVYAVIQEPK